MSNVTTEMENVARFVCRVYYGATANYDKMALIKRNWCLMQADRILKGEVVKASRAIILAARNDERAKVIDQLEKEIKKRR